MAVPRQSQATLLGDLPPELLQKIFDLCAHDVFQGRKSLLSLSIMNKYFRSIATSWVFKHICFRDHAQSPGNEILHSIRRFMAAPGLSSRARTISLYLNRADSCRKPYHYLVLPELVEALVKMTDVSELYLHSENTPGRLCMEGLEAAVHWSTEGRELNIRSLTVSYRSCVDCSSLSEEEPDRVIDFLAALPQLKSLSLPGHYFQPTIAPGLKQLRLFKTRSVTFRSLYSSHEWREGEISRLRLRTFMPELEYLSVLGELRRFPVSHLLEQLTDIPKLKYVDVTDEQRYSKGLWHWGLSDLERAAHNHPMNEDRSELARQTFENCAQLQRICFVRCSVGEVYLRGYHDAVADSTGYISQDINDADLGHIPGSWCHGVPQTSFLPFPDYTPWEELNSTSEIE